MLAANLATEYPLSTHVANPGSGTIIVDHVSDDRYYREGTPIQLRAQPSPLWEFVRWTGDIEGRDPAAMIQMDRPIHVEAVFSQAPEIKPGSSQSVVLPTADYTFFVYDKVSGYRVHAPANASELRISFDSSTPGADVGLFVTADSEFLPWRYGEDGRTPMFLADFQSRSNGSSETIVITPDSIPPLDAASAYHVSLVVFTPRTEIRGTLRAEFKQDFSPHPSAAASPRALTFVSPSHTDPASQFIRLANDGVASLRYAVDSDQEWLSAYPGNGFIASGATAKIEVSVQAAGRWPDTYRGELKVTSPVQDAENPVLLASIPVTFVVVPAYASDSTPQ